MKQIIQNLLHVFKRFRTATVLNMLGLSIAFASFIVIMMQVNYDYTFDRHHTDYDRIYRIELVNPEGGKQAIVSRGLAEELFRTSPEIETGAIWTWREDIHFNTDKLKMKELFTEKTFQVSKTFTDVFRFDMISGSAKALNEPDHILIPQSLAKKYFGDKEAVGQTIYSDKDDYIIGGVYKDFPKNSSIQNLFYFAIDDNQDLNNWQNHSYMAFVKLKSKEQPNLIGQHIVVPEQMTKYGYTKPELGLTPLAKLHTTTDIKYDVLSKADPKTIYILLTIAGLILVIAGVNFTNFSMALVPMRIKNINTRKVLGADQLSLRLLNLSEAAAICFISYLLALLWVYMAGMSPIKDLVETPLALNSYPFIVVGTGIIALLLGIAVGIYPAYYITSFKPALVLKGSFGLTIKGRNLRNALIGTQFIVSFTLIICTSFMYLQNHFVRSSSLGFDKDQLIVVQLPETLSDKGDILRNELKAFSDIKAVSFTQTLLSGADEYMSWGRNYKGEEINYTCILAEHTLLDVLGIKVTEGRNFREGDENLKFGAYIFNEAAQKKYDLEIGLKVDSTIVIGFTENFNFASFRKEIEPMGFFIYDFKNKWKVPFGFMYVKVEAGSDMFAAMDQVKGILKKLEPALPSDARFYDSILNELYKNELKMTGLITLFSLIAILISIAGVFGLVVFECEYKRKEISIRKVNGSSVGEILLLFNKGYMRILLVCFVIAVPISYYAADTWLQNFAYRTTMYWWIFLIGGLLIALITIATINFQSWRAARTNPVDALKNE